MAAETKNERKKGKQKEGNSIISGVRTYISEVRTEINKVTWPERPDIIRLTRIVLIVTVVSGLVLGALSLFFSEFIQIGLEFPIIFVVTFAAIIAITIYMFQRDKQKVGY